MEHRSTFDLMHGNALIQQWDIMAEIEADRDGDWYIAGIYADCLEKDGKPARGAFDWVRVPGTDPLYREYFKHFSNACRADIDERWERHGWRYEPRDFYSNQAGRTL